MRDVVCFCHEHFVQRHPVNGRLLRIERSSALKDEDLTFRTIHGLYLPASPLTSCTSGQVNEVRRKSLGQEAPSKTWAAEKWFRDRARQPYPHRTPCKDPGDCFVFQHNIRRADTYLTVPASTTLAPLGFFCTTNLCSGTLYSRNLREA